MSSADSSTELLTALISVRQALAGAPLHLDLPGIDEVRRERQGMVDKLEDYILPRLVQIDAPLLAVVGGSTGAGKSTLVNTLVGRVVSEAGVLRPTTRSPVLVHHPNDAEWFAPDRILPGRARTTSPSTGAGALHLVPADSVPPGLAILDAPDVDSVEVANRELASELLAAADLWLFVTSAARYADKVPWDYLRSAAERATAVAIVLDRTPSEAVEEVRGHLARMLTSRGLRDSPLFTVPEGEVDDDGLLPIASVHEIQDWLSDLGADSEARAAVIAQTLQGAVRQLAYRTHSIADAVAAQQEATAQLRDDVDRSFTTARKAIADATGDGTMLRGEVLARWQEFVGAGEFTRALERRIGRLRDRLLSTVRVRSQSPERVGNAVEQGLHSLLIEHAEEAAERAQASWESTQAGRSLVAEAGGILGRASRDFRVQAERAVREWQSDVLAMVREQGADKRTTARFLAYGVNGLGVALMIVMFSQTYGLSGGEAGIAGGTAVVAQKLLEAVFGDQAVRTLAARARDDLNHRAGALLEVEKKRFLDVLDSAGAPDGGSVRIRDAARAIDDQRLGLGLS